VVENKTKATAASVADYLETVDSERRADARVIDGIMRRTTGAEPKMWGASIIGYGETRLVYESGRELDWFRTGFAPRKGKFALYVGAGAPDVAPLLGRLGKHTTGKGCLYISRLADVDLGVLEEIVQRSAARTGELPA
jgi:hypothetical protein